MRRAVAVAALLLAAGCGVKAPPRPPVEPASNPGGPAAPAQGT
ncbi:MAG TPA: hypothetical protein VLT47_15005 [Anaeromyxobacteraceae bacterium]|nr:hypothetical protein [Anaeromyxobacteraceae bacterium]